MKRAFSIADLAEIPLDPPPLSAVVAQLRFPPVLSLGEENGVVPFQAALIGDYPVLREQRQHQVVFGPSGAVTQPPETVWRFADLTDEWSVSLARDFVAIETTAYSTRGDFVIRLRKVLDALEALAKPSPVAVFDRLGVRYVNQLVGGDASIANLRRYVRDEILGALLLDEDETAPKLAACLTQARFDCDGPVMQVRWGRVQPGELVVPGVPVTPDESFLLDIDVFYEGSARFDPEAVADSAQHAAALAYGFFRWAMKPAFVEERKA